MTDQEYGIMQQQIMGLGNVISQMPFDDFIARIDDAMKTEPTRNPVLYAQVHNTLVNLKDIAESMKKTQKLIKKISSQVVVVTQRELRKA